ncbi:metal ABC transporter substrate-binding protein [Paenibacillus sp. sptzw28]|uniref:metal ABC transporter substrate-binding protein n=1 Tax=Paenibacillus sp. sptzw28 TaxID=715179 RepID=UPI001C6E0DA2|nr:metal ABC transporter substrate-binding protein [Paenibacillus sp. sptzw28]QYR19580.1 metal ABC transporter substrate-binding protein [Paenibacillus sp. sptzw28]
MKAKITKSFLMAAAVALVLSGCAGKSGNSSEGSANAGPAADAGKKLKVVTTFYPMYEFSKQIGGDHADVVALIPPGAEPHDWEPSAKDMAQIKEADVFVYNGIVEGWAEQALESAANDKRVAVEASSGIDLMEGVPEEEEPGHHDNESGHVLDPHVWLDPVLAQQEVTTILAGFEKADPANAADYKKNADSFIAKLKELDTAYRTGLENVKLKDFVTQHAAFGYLAKQYGLTQIPIAGLSPDQEPSPEKMAEIVKFAKEHQVKTIFFETLVDPQVAGTVANEIGAKTDVLNPLEGLTEEDKKNDLDYIGIMKQNLAALEKALNE